MREALREHQQELQLLETAGRPPPSVPWPTARSESGGGDGGLLPLPCRWAETGPPQRWPVNSPWFASPGGRACWAPVVQASGLEGKGGHGAMRLQLPESPAPAVVTWSLDACTMPLLGAWLQKPLMNMFLELKSPGPCSISQTLYPHRTALASVFPHHQ